MLKSNTAKVVVVLAFFSIWGILFYRIYQKVNPPMVNYQLPDSPTIITKASASVDTFSLLLDYPDPFLKKTVRQTRPTKNTTVKPKSKPSSKNQKLKNIAIPFPEVAYKGYVSIKNGEKVALVSINKKLEHLSLGTEYEGVKLLKIAPDSIEISFNQKTKKIGKFTIKPTQVVSQKKRKKK